jgi:hypothetical protein
VTGLGHWEGTDARSGCGARHLRSGAPRRTPVIFLLAILSLLRRDRPPAYVAAAPHPNDRLGWRAGLRLIERARAAVATRDDRPWLGAVAAPLAITAVVLACEWPLLIPLSGLAWWWAPRPWRWSWLLPVQAGLVGAEWAYVGAVFLGGYPAARPLIATCWSGTAAAFAAWSARHRHQHGGPWLELGR